MNESQDTGHPADDDAGSRAANFSPEDSAAQKTDQDAAAADAIADQFATHGRTGDADELSLEVQLAEANVRTLRLQAELDNFRKRAFRQMEDERKYAVVPLLRDILTVVDNLERAIHAAEKNENSAGLLEGVRMVDQQLAAVLKKHECLPIEAAGKPFDPNQHEAIAQQPSDEFAAGTVAAIAQTGYQLHDRVVRPTQVLVSTGPASAGPDAE